MASIQDSAVYLSLNFDFSDESSTDIHWSGHCEYSSESGYENGPDFEDASDAVTWWRKRGARRILIRLDLRETLWAGDGSPPSDDKIGVTISVFDPSDPRDRPKGAR
jgi:hypothetical protein